MDEFEFLRHAPLANLDMIPTPDEVPEPIFRPQVNGGEISDTLEAVLSQNEDLMARLKVNLRRLSEMETSLLFSKKEKAKTEKAYQVLMNEKRVWDEKENQWRQRLLNTEAQLSAVPTLKTDYNKALERLERFKKYQEKIKTQVKPYVQNLKAYSESLVSQTRSLNGDLSNLESRFDSCENERQVLTQRLNEKEVSYAQHIENLQTRFEQQSRLIKLENQELKGKLERLELQAQGLDDLRSRETDLENLVVALRREIDAQAQSHSNQLHELRSELSQSKKSDIESKMRLESLEQKLKVSFDESTRWQNRSESADEQLAALRLVWSDKCKDFDQLKSGYKALESLNQELSQRLLGSR